MGAGDAAALTLPLLPRVVAMTAALSAVITPHPPPPPVPPPVPPVGLHPHVTYSMWAVGVVASFSPYLPYAPTTSFLCCATFFSFSPAASTPYNLCLSFPAALWRMALALVRGTNVVAFTG